MVGTDGVGSIWTAADKAALVQAVFPAVAAADVGTGDDCVTCGSCSDQLWRRAVDDWRCVHTRISSHWPHQFAHTSSVLCLPQIRGRRVFGAGARTVAAQLLVRSGVPDSGA